MGRREVLTVARLEAGEVLRDPQLGFLLAAIVALVHLGLLAGQRLDAQGGVFVVVGLGPLGLLFLAAPRRGAAHEQAFLRVVRTCPVSARDWFWGRVLGLHALSAAYLALTGPALAVELSVAEAPWRAAANALLGFAAFSALVVFAALAASGRSGVRATALALGTFAFVAGYRANALPLLASGEWARRLADLAVAALPSTQVGMAGGFVGGVVEAPAWGLAAGLAGTLALAAGLAAEAHDAPFAPRWAWASAWAVGVLVLAASLREPWSAQLTATREGAWDGFGLLPLFALGAAAPAAVALTRAARARRGRASTASRAPAPRPARPGGP